MLIMKIKLPATFIITCFIAAIAFDFIALAAIDSPHNESSNVNCGSCHGQGLLNSPFWGGGMSYDQLCLNCHTASSGPYSDTNAPLVKTHSSENTSENYGIWSRECRNCHDPHYQKQKNYKNTDAGNLYLATGTIINCVDNGNGTSTLTYSSINYKTGWDAARLLEKTSEYRRAILFPNVGKLGYSYLVIGIDEGAQEITVSGDATPVYQYISTSTFAMMYGQYIKDAIDVSGTNKQVKFFDRKGIKSYADGDATYDGVCEVCHTQTLYHKNDGTGNYHYPAARCYVCHDHIKGFKYDHGEPGKDCEDCHGHDDGWNGGSYYGTTQSHSTHTENDSDDLKGPYITCSDCHDTNNYPFFKSGTDGNGDGKYNLSETDVCDNCHSPGGAFDGVNNPTHGAKANWAGGVYASTTLKTGKEKWCAGCHDDQPAYSKGQHIEIIVDNTDPGASHTGTWNTSNSLPGYYGTNYHFHTTGAGIDTFTWTPSISSTGIYSVYARWTEDTGRAPDATYTIYHAGGSTQVSVDQRSNGGTWVFLGTFSFDGVGDKVELVQNPNGYVIADAIKWESGIQATHAPNVIGDNTIYGFYVTGHKINCLNCHSADKKHIDGKHRTYKASVTPYSNSYRLRDINGQPAMVIPRPLYPVNTNPLTHPDDFALCFDCHNKNDIMTSTGIPGETNFWNNDSSPGNSHNIHLSIYTNHFDSDWDLVLDSSESCIACHNVHGSPTKAMIRHGELISTPETTDKVPSLNFSYLKGDVYEATATWLFTGAGGSYNVYARWTSGPTRTSSAKYIVNYNSGSDSEAILKDQRSNGGQWVQLGTVPYLFGAGDSVVLSIEGADGYVIADAIGWDTDGTFTGDLDGDGTLDPEIVVDNLNASYTPSEWAHSSSVSGYHGTDYQYHYQPGATPVADPDLNLDQSIGGQFNYAGSQPSLNGVCGACHSAIYYLRSPNLSPRVINAQADPDTVQNDMMSSSLITAYVLDHDNNVSTVTVDLSSIGGSDSQTMYDDGTHGDVTAGDGTYSYTATIPSGTSDSTKNLVITATGTNANTGQHAAMLYVVEPGATYIDNKQGSSTGSWPAASYIAGFYGEDYQYHLGGSGTDTFTWTITVTLPGTYEVFARWTQDPGRAPDATYTVYHDGGSTPVSVDQRSNGGQWVSLGTYDFDGTDDYIELVQNPNGYVIADAIKLAPEP